ncbi:MAG: hypothetical protein SGILL_007109, partial [Bacillariaceae sp.]
LEFATQLTLLEGSECGNLTCFEAAAANDNWRCADTFTPAASSTLNWRSEAGKEYHIIVHGYRPSTTGNFDITVSEFEIVDENNFCRDALELEPDDNVVGSTQSAAIAFFGEDLYCGAPIDNAGLWYSIEGTDEELSLYGCTAGGGDFEASISVFEGSCSNMSCVAGETFAISCSNLVDQAENRLLQPQDEINVQPAVTWFADANTTYQILVHGQAPNFTFDGGTGLFELVIGEGLGNGTGLEEEILDTIPPTNETAPTPSPTVPNVTPQPTVPPPDEAPIEAPVAPVDAPVASPTDAPVAILTASPTPAGTPNVTVQGEGGSSGYSLARSALVAAGIAILGSFISVM